MSQEALGPDLVRGQCSDQACEGQGRAGSDHQCGQQGTVEVMMRVERVTEACVQCQEHAIRGGGEKPIPRCSGTEPG